MVRPTTGALPGARASAANRSKVVVTFGARGIGAAPPAYLERRARGNVGRTGRVRDASRASRDASREPHHAPHDPAFGTRLVERPARVCQRLEASRGERVAHGRAAPVSSA